MKRKFYLSSIFLLIFILITGCNIKDTNKNKYTDEQIYEQLFDINNKVSVTIDISEEELLKIQKDYEDFEKIGSKSPIYRMCNLIISINEDEYTIEGVGIRMKGNTSRRSFYDEEKGIYNLIHYKLKFTETFDDEDDYKIEEIKKWTSDELRKERKQRTFATLEGLELKWNKNYDGTHIRTYLAYDLFEKFDYLAPNSTLSKVSIKHFGKIENLGVFDLNEPVDEIFLEKHLSKEQLGGDLYKVGWGFGKGGMFTPDTIEYIGKEDEHDGYFPIYDLKTNKKTSDYSDLINIITKLNKSNPDLDELFEMDYFTKFAALSYAIGNPDDYRNNYNNYYIYILNNTKQAIFIPYDLDRAYGTTKDWAPLEDGCSKVDPLSTNSLHGYHPNKLIIKSVTHDADNIYKVKYINNLKDIAGSGYFHDSYINNVFTIFENNFGDDYRPSIKEISEKCIEFTLEDNNYNIFSFIKNIKKKIYNID